MGRCDNHRVISPSDCGSRETWGFWKQRWACSGAEVLQHGLHDSYSGIWEHGKNKDMVLVFGEILSFCLSLDLLVGFGIKVLSFSPQ